MKPLQIGIDSRGVCSIERRRGVAERLRFPLSDRDRVEVEALCKLHNGLVALDRDEGHLGLERRRVVSPSTSCDVYSLWRASSPPDEQSHHLFGCPIIRGHANVILLALRLAELAVEFGKNGVVALTRGGHSLAHLAGDLDGAIVLLDRALIVDPKLVAAWFLGGYLRAWRGAKRAIEHFTWAMRLGPLDPEMYRI